MINVITLHRLIQSNAEMFSDIEEELFIKIVEMISAEGYYALTLCDAFTEKCCGEKSPIIALAFDDGWSSHYSFVFPLLRERQMGATFFITTNWVGKKDFLTWEQIREMSEAGMEIGSHTLNHPMLTDLKNKEEIKKEVTLSKSLLEEKLGREIKSFSFPGGFYNNEIVKIVRDAGYSTICTSKPGLNFSPKGLIRRNSINRLTDCRELPEVLAPGRISILKRGILHNVKGSIMNLLGERSYLILREKLFR